MRYINLRFTYLLTNFIFLRFFNLVFILSFCSVFTFYIVCLCDE